MSSQPTNVIPFPAAASERAPTGQIAIAREALRHPVVGVHVKQGRWLAGWVELIALVTHRDREVDCWGSSMILRRGQAIISIRRLADDLHWTVKQVRGFLTALEREQMISRETVSIKKIGKSCKNKDLAETHPKKGTANAPKRARGGAQQVTILTICNYDVFQPKLRVEDTQGAQVRAQQSDQKGHINNKDSFFTNVQKESDSVRFEKTEPEIVQDDPTDPLPEQIPEQHPEHRPDPASEPAMDWLSEFDRINGIQDKPRPEPELRAEEAFAIFDQAMRYGGNDRRRVLTTKRKADLRKFLAQTSAEDWREACERIAASDFLTTTGWRGRGVSLDWVLNETNFAKIVEGRFDRDLRPVQAPTRTGYAAPRAYPADCADPSIAKEQYKDFHVPFDYGE